MAKNLVIVESPAKVKTIKKFLGKNYEVTASNGHVRDLPKSTLGIDVENDFEPKYITIRGKGDILANLRKEVKKADKIYLATDPDREGEAISWHLSQALNLDEKNVKRITFNEITKSAVKESLKHPREINMDLVDAQQTRRILDRMVGYRISPLLWAKVKRGLSAGRVQSAALRIICDREDEIAAFIPEEYWTLDAHLLPEGAKKPIIASFCGDSKGKIQITNKDQLDEILAALEGAEYKVLDIKKNERTKKPPLPFSTSTLQQEASRHLNFSTQKTMRLAQQLYEGVNIKGSGSVGLITYLRTDSTRVSEEAVTAATAYIEEVYGEAYTAHQTAAGSSDARIQDAHEAIRPTDIRYTPAKVKDSLTRDQYRLYQIIWNRFVASRMTAAVYETTSVKISAGKYRFNLSSSRVVFDGFMSVYSLDEKKSDKALSKNLEKGAVLEKQDLTADQHFTQPPPHFTEATLVKTMEELGIGRPSTYAPTITTLISRRYVIKENKNLYVSELGEVVNRIMKEEFSEIVDEQFTANMESLLDDVEDGTIDWKMVVRNFYPDLDEAVKAAEQNLEKVEIRDEVSDEICELCGRNMVVKYGPHGRFLACPGFPECRNTKPLLEKIGVSCPKCGKDIVLKKTRKGRKYYGCEDNPNCDFMSWQKPSSKPCPECGGYMVERGNKLVCADPNCGHVEEIAAERIKDASEG
ncbi:MAG: type I DNA topoisomerase [Lachnospiraceae bacterium]|nr:type I DNA topoisomerase [Lachnospiraceae bacterium]